MTSQANLYWERSESALRADETRRLVELEQATANDCHCVGSFVCLKCRGSGPMILPRQARTSGLVTTSVHPTGDGGSVSA
jgi:hypothetical protein